MKAKLLPLDKKYYSTEIDIVDEKGNTVAGISLWSNDYEPSIREIESWGLTQDDWDNNKLVDDGWGNMTPVRETDYKDPGGHFERVLVYQLAQIIVNAINKRKPQLETDSQGHPNHF